MFEKDSAPVKNPKHMQKKVFRLYSPRQLKTEPVSCKKIDTEVTAFLPANSKGFLTSRLSELFHGKHRLWIEILRKSFEDDNEIKRGVPLAFLLVDPENLKFHHVLTKKKTKEEKKGGTMKTKKQTGGFLSRYDFAYARRDTVNQTAKVAPGVIKAATNDNNIAKQRIDPIISQGGNKVERVLLKILRGAIEDICQTPFRQLGNFGK